MPRLPAFSERDIDYHSVIVSDACTSAEIDNHIQFMQRVFPRTGRVRTTDEVLEMLQQDSIGSYGQ
jgi:ureidoacrylate peracid hydrolase